MAKNKSKKAEATLATAVAAGIVKHFSNVNSLTIQGVSMTPAQIATSLQTLATLRSESVAAQAVAKAKVAAENAQAPALRSTLSAVVTVVKAAFGNQADVLVDFGVPPTKARATPTSEEKALAVVKRAATRAARHTASAQQKADIKGNVTSIVVTPVTASQGAPSTSSVAAPPASAGGANGGPAPQGH